MSPDSTAPHRRPSRSTLFGRRLRAGLPVALFTALSAHALAAAPPAAPRAPKLGLIVAIDGLSWERLDSFRPHLEFGLKRLLVEGQVESECRYRHLNTETGPGHSSLGAGAPPRVTGIVANRWFELKPDGSGLRSVSCAQQWDPAPVPGKPPLFYREVEKDGRLYVFALSGELERWQQSGELGKATTRLGAGPKGETLVFDSDDAIHLFNLRHGRPAEELAPSRTITGPGNLRVPTLADRLVAARPGSRVVSLSAKDRSAVFLAGRDPRHVVYWYDRDTGRFVSSSAYDANRAAGAAGKAVVDAFNRDEAGARLVSRFGLLWKKLPPPAQGPPLPQPPRDLFDFQLPAQGLGFDHDLSRDPQGYSAGFYVSPFVDELLADLTLAFLDSDALALGRRSDPDLLLLSFSAQDVVSHSYGSDSEENVDTLRRLDRQLARLLEALERRVGKDGVALALSADHGFGVIPEVHARDHPGDSAGRLVSSGRAVPSFVERLNRMLEDELCLPRGTRPVYGVEGWSLAYNRTAFPARSVDGPCGAAGRAVTLADLDAALPRVIARHFGEEIESVLPIAQRGAWPAGRASECARNDLDLERSGDAFLVPRANVIMHWDPARGTGHGSHHDYDTHVPLVFWGGAFTPRVVTGDSTPYDVAPTLGALLGVALPDAAGTSRLRAN
jgi:hypothetical protein